MTATDYKNKMQRDQRDRLDRFDPDKMLESLRAQGARFTKTQMRTLVFDDSDQLARILRASPEVAVTFICMTRDPQGNAKL
jgi:hypothetical protein